MFDNPLSFCILSCVTSIMYNNFTNSIRQHRSSGHELRGTTIMRKLITVLLTAILTASLSALPCLAEVSVQKENEEPKETTAETSTKLTSFDGGPMVEYRGEDFKIQFDTGETKAPFLDSDKRESPDLYILRCGSYNTH